MPVVDDPRRQAVRIAAAVLGVAVVWLTVLAFTRSTPVDLTVALLVVLAEVLAVAVLSGPVLAVLVALAAVVLINWYLVPPYGTFQISSADNVAALIVFAFVAVVAASLVEVGARARARARESTRQAALLGDIVATEEGEAAVTALERVRTGLGLEYVELRRSADARSSVVVASAGRVSDAPLALHLDMPDGYLLEGRGPELFAPDPDFLASLGAAAVRAFESDRMQQETERADELESVDRARTALLASVGHDLRTPLASLRVSIDTLRSPDADLSTDDRAALLATVAASTERLDELITNLLDMSRLQAGAVPAQVRETDLAEVIPGALLSYPDDRIQVEVPESLPTVAADATLLERMIANLLSNALRYAPPGSPVLVSAHQESGCVVLTVSDRGPGIPLGQENLVFEPFHRIHAQADGGTGLGLAIVKGFAEATSIEVDLSPGASGGLEARLRIPTWQGQS
jgi:two-component system, OmpR family, sensor histidine kinase KdpD